MLGVKKRSEQDQRPVEEGEEYEKHKPYVERTGHSNQIYMKGGS